MMNKIVHEAAIKHFDNAVGVTESGSDDAGKHVEKTFVSENSLGQKFAKTKTERFSHNSLLRTKCKVFNGKPGFNVQLSLCYNFFMEEVSHYKM